jgi:hypothetical protein
LINRLSNAKIIVTSIGSLTDFNNSLLKENKSDTSFDYTLNFIKQLIKVITNNDEYLMGLDES